ncbi:MAG: HIT domain-containing protein [Chloroflexi bacterium]|nr:MAG: HIT domain-containing protein [Chloroflexota bacterium]
MERLYSPWRMKYVSSMHKSDECIFCAKLNDDPARDRENLVVFRAASSFVVMNLYPYNTGHLMVVPNQHVARLSDVPPAVQAEMMALTTYFVDLLTAVMRPDGFNIGMNLGRVAGAGIDTHLHLHIVPRWAGDSNFMPVIGSTRVLPEDLGATYDKIVAYLQQNPPAV